MFFVLLILGFLAYKGLIAGHTVPILKRDAIWQYQTVTLGGAEQSILMRGENAANPVLLYIHGGPGDPETPFIVPYQKKWEEKFIVVNWDQRGCGRSYHDDIDRSTITTEQICADATELTQYLKDRFHTDKIYLAAHSYGTYVGMRCIQKNPNDYYAYVGFGQIGNQQDNEKYLLSYAAKMAEENNNKEALNELSTLGKFPYSNQEFGKKISLSRKWTRFYGGAIYGKSNTNRLTIESILLPEYSLVDLICYKKGQGLYHTNTEKDQVRLELFHADLANEVPSVSVPVYFIQGKNDFTTSFQACEEYFEKLQAPYKELIPLEYCAHNPVMECPEQVSGLLTSILLTER